MNDQLEIEISNIESNPIKILLIEDNPVDASIIQKMLGQAREIPFEVECMDRLYLGMERLAAGDIDVILLDLSLPDSEGFETFARTFAQAPNVPIVIVTGQDDEKGAVEAINRGAQDYLIKGEIDIKPLSRSIRYAIERKRIEEALRESENRFRLLTENATDIIWIMDLNLQPTYISPSIHHIRGYTVQEAMNQTMEEILTSGSFEIARESFAEGLAEENSGADNLLTQKTLELEHNCKDGSTIWCEIKATFLRDGDGQPVGLLGVSRDINERKQAEEALKASKESFHNIVEASLDGVIILDVNGIVRFVNPVVESFFKCRAEDLIGSTFDYPVVKDGATEIEISRKNGIKGIAEMRMIETEWGGEKASLALLRDITELKQMLAGMEERNRELKEANERLLELDRMKNDFVSTVSHELRTPLAAIKDAVSIINEGLAGEVNEKQTKLVHLALSNSERLSIIINDLLDFSKLDAGKVQMKKASSDIGEIIDDSALSLDNLAQKKRVTLSTAVPETLQQAYIDGDRLGQVLINLIGNAIKFTQDGGSIQVGARELPEEEIETVESGGFVIDRFLEISVKDTGMGIAPEDLDKVFDKFQQVESTAGPGIKGTGLGLAISRKIVELHNGRIWVESEEGKGSTFYFTVPEYSDELFFHESFESALVSADERGTSMALLALNIANLPRILEEHGKETAEELFTTVQKILQSKMRRREDTVLSYREGEFLAVLAESDPDGARAIADNLKGSLACYEFDFPVKLQIGDAVYPEDGKNRLEIIRAAENRFRKFPTRMKDTASKGAWKILVVDDDRVSVEMFSKWLEKAGYTALRAYGGRESIDIIQQESVDLVLLDLAMPDISGYGVIGYLKTNEVTKDIPILVLSASYADENELRRLGDAAMPRLLKGCERNVLLETVERLLQDG